MPSNRYTHIPVEKSLRTDLRDLKRDNETWSGLLRRIMEEDR